MSSNKFHLVANAGGTRGPAGGGWQVAGGRSKARRAGEAAGCGRRIRKRINMRVMKFLAMVEPPEPMRGLEVPAEVVAALGGGARPRVIITVNGHTWKSRIAIMRGRNLIGLSNANRQAAGVSIGDEVEVDVAFDPETPTVTEPADFAGALDADPVARAAYDRLSYSHRREHVLAIEGAKKPETRARRIEKAIELLRGDAQGPEAQRRELDTYAVSTSRRRRKRGPAWRVRLVVTGRLTPHRARVRTWRWRRPRRPGCRPEPRSWRRER